MVRQWIIHLVDVILFTLCYFMNWLITKPVTRQKALAYKGTLPNPPKAIAVVWADDAKKESAVRHLAEILQWCHHGQLEAFCIYDPEGALKAQSDLFHRLLPHEEYWVKAGWADCLTPSIALCELCRNSADGGGGDTVSADCCGAPNGNCCRLLGPALGTEPSPGSTSIAAAVAGPPVTAAAGGAAGNVTPSAPDTTIFESAAALRDSKAAAALTAAAASAEAPCACQQTVRGVRRRCAQAAGEETCREGCCQVAPQARPRSDPASSASCTGVVQPAPACQIGELRTSGPCGACGGAGPVSEAQGSANGLCAPNRLGASAASPQPLCQGSSPTVLSGGFKYQKGSQPGPTRTDEAPKPLTGLPDRRGIPNGSGRVSVHLLSAEDGYSPVLLAARSGGVCSACGAVTGLKGGPYREGLARLRTQMAELAGPAVLIQPELVLVVGPALTLAGYPPFQVAASEILHLGPSDGMCKARVDAAIAKFLRTEQRFGK